MEEFRPAMRPVELLPAGEHQGQPVFLLRDPEGFAGLRVLPQAAAAMVTLLDGQRSVEQLLEAAREQFGLRVPQAELEQFIAELDQEFWLQSPNFREHERQQNQAYLDNPVRPAAHAGGAYEGEFENLREQLRSIFTEDGAPGLPPNLNGVANSSNSATGHVASPLRGILSPHIDLRRGGKAFAHAYHRLAEETTADLFVIFGTAHRPMRNLFGVSRKHFETPLGTVSTDREYADRIASLFPQHGGPDVDLFADELAHRNEHSIEFQVLFLQYLWGGKRPFQVLPVLTGSFHAFMNGQGMPEESAEVRAFVAALREAEQDHDGQVCYVSGGDLAHIGQRFGDASLLDRQRLEEQSHDDQTLLRLACGDSAEAFFGHVSDKGDRHRICGLSPTYTMLRAMGPTRGEILHYDQAVEQDGTACVSFGSVAFYAE